MTKPIPGPDECLGARCRGHRRSRGSAAPTAIAFAQRVRNISFLMRPVDIRSGVEAASPDELKGKGQVGPGAGGRWLGIKLDQRNLPRCERRCSRRSAVRAALTFCSLPVQGLDDAILRPISAVEAECPRHLAGTKCQCRRTRVPPHAAARSAGRLRWSIDTQPAATAAWTNCSRFLNYQGSLPRHRSRMSTGR